MSAEKKKILSKVDVDIQRICEGCKDVDIDTQIKVFIENRVPVELYYNKETGKYKWSVSVYCTDFWLDSFATEAKARQFCAENKLPIQRTRLN